MKKLFFATILLSAFLTNAFDQLKEVKLRDGRMILAAASGMTLYTFDEDDAGVSNCFGRCLSVWPAMIVSANDRVTAPFATTRRPDGSLQLMLNDSPLYFFVGDRKEGDINGDGLQGTWHIIEL